MFRRTLFQCVYIYSMPENGDDAHELKMHYDGGYVLKVPESKIKDTTNWPRPFLSNGKVVLRPSIDDSIDIPLTQIIVAAGKESDLAPNLIPTFGFGKVQFFRRQPVQIPVGAPAPESAAILDSKLEYTLTGAELHMDTGTYTTTHDIHQNGVFMASVTRTVFPVRTHQFLTKQTFKVLVAKHALDDACFFHELIAPDDVRNYSITHRDVNFSAPLLFSEGAGSSILFTGHVPNRGLAVSSAYSWTSEAKNFSSEFEVLGYNVVSVPSSEHDGIVPLAFNKVRMIAPEDARDSDYEFHFQILTCSMTASDSSNPSLDTQQILVREARKALAKGQLRTEHVKAWDALWRRDITIVPKLGISSEESHQIQRIKRHLRYSLYLLFSSARSREEELGSFGAISPYYRSLYDPTGLQTAQSDVWLMPAFLLIHPNAARAILQFRHAILPDAKEGAAFLARDGAYFPFSNLSSGGTLFATIENVSVFATALLGSNAWDWYRISKDKEWLEHTGYPLISNIADFVASCFVRDSQGRFVLVESLGLDGNSNPHNSFSVNSCMLALRAAVHAAYILSRPPRRAWTEVVSSVRTIFLDHGSSDPDLKWIYRRHQNDSYFSSFDKQLTDELQTDKDGRSPWLGLIDPLFIATPVQAQVSHPNRKNLTLAIKNNLAFYEPRLWLGGAPPSSSSSSESSSE